MTVEGQTFRALDHWGDVSMKSSDERYLTHCLGGEGLEE